MVPFCGGLREMIPPLEGLGGGPWERRAFPRRELRIGGPGEGRSGYGGALAPCRSSELPAQGMGCCGHSLQWVSSSPCSQSSSLSHVQLMGMQRPLGQAK